MLPRPQLSNKQLAELCHRVAVEADAGIDVRRTWQRETDMASPRLKPYLAQVRDAVARGDSLAAALAGGGVFPSLLLELAHVGEATGTIPQVFRRLEGHYRQRAQAGRVFLGAIAWPVIELVFAIVAIGVLIWVLGLVAARGGRTIDVLGFGLVGTPGLLIYTNIIVAFGLCITGLVIAWRRGMLWTKPLQRALLRLPGVGRALEKVALSRVAWMLHLTLNVAMDLRRALPLVLRATGNDHYIRHTSQIVADVGSGLPLHVALARSGAFPAEFLDALAVAEESGQAVESMDRLSRRYEEEAEAAIKMLAVVFGFLVAVLVMAIIVFMIFRLAGFYFGAIQEAVDMAR